MTRLEVGRVAPGWPVAENPDEKITLSASRDIPFNKLMLSQSDEDDDTGEAQSAEDGGEPAIGDSEPSGEDEPVTGNDFARTAAE